MNSAHAARSNPSGFVGSLYYDMSYGTVHTLGYDFFTGGYADNASAVRCLSIFATCHMVMLGYRSSDFEADAAC